MISETICLFLDADFILHCIALHCMSVDQNRVLCKSLFIMATAETCFKQIQLSFRQSLYSRFISTKSDNYILLAARRLPNQILEDASAGPYFGSNYSSWV